MNLCGKWDWNPRSPVLGQMQGGIVAGGEIPAPPPLYETLVLQNHHMHRSIFILPKIFPPSTCSVHNYYSFVCFSQPQPHVTRAAGYDVEPLRIDLVAEIKHAR